MNCDGSIRSARSFLSTAKCTADLEHEPVFNVKHDLLLVPVVADESVYGVAVGHPANETRVGREGDDRIALNSEER